MRSVLFGLLQLAGALAAAAGVYLLFGLAWSLVIVGGLVFLTSTAVEMMSGRTAPPSARRPVRRGPPDALPEPDRVTELPGAVRSRLRKEG
jgi:small neutral amino acid transporter SnatA (MarC family)